MNDTIFGMTEEELQAFNKAHDEAYPNQDYHLITLPEGMKIDVDKLEAEVKRGITSIGRNKDIPHECICSRDQVVHFGCKCGGI